MEADISQLEAPTFTTISRGPPEPMLRLSWDHKVSLIGEKVLNPMIHCCDQCTKPILIYGRMIPCKHVFCLKCARSEPISLCPRCNEKVSRVEQSGLGSVFMCTHGGTRYGNSGCRRTYLSQRDLQAHINHRHMENIAKPHLPIDNKQVTTPNVTSSPRKTLEPQCTINSGINQRNPTNTVSSARGNIVPGYTVNPAQRTNLITVPIQDSQQNISQVIGIGGQQQIADIAASNYYNPVQQTNPYSSPYSSQQFSNIPAITPTKNLGPPTQQIHNLSINRTNPSLQYFNQPHYAQQPYNQIPALYQQSAGRGGYDPQNYNVNTSTSSSTNPTWNQPYYR